jgi:hypothetical protein
MRYVGREREGPKGEQEIRCRGQKDRNAMTPESEQRPYVSTQRVGELSATTLVRDEWMSSMQDNW